MKTATAGLLAASIMTAGIATVAGIYMFTQTGDDTTIVANVAMVAIASTWIVALFFTFASGMVED